RRRDPGLTSWLSCLGPEQGSLFSTQAALACYKQRSEEFKKLFKELPEAERLIMDFACALQRDILMQGRLYLSEHWLCFHSNVFWGTTLMVALKNITAMTREKTARIIPNAIQICTEAEKLFFTSFSGREKSFQGIFRLWQKSVADKPLTESELWLMVRHHYGNELELELSLDDMMMMMTDVEILSVCVIKDNGSLPLLQTEERLCPSQVQGRVFVNRVFHISADKMFELLFTDSPFNRRFMGARKVTDTSDSVKRTLTYTVTITNPLVGKSSRATETQVLYKKKHEEQHYMVETEVYMHDVPYHDYFYTLNRYCIIYNSKRKCRLRIHTDVKYKKQPWGLAKSFITKNSWSGLEEYFRHLEAELLDEEAELTQGPGDLSKAGGLRRRRRAYSRSLPEHLKPGKQYSGDAGQRRESLAGWP
uniref:GRAM domain containing 1C n=1 Tax=Scleropages formosus TaxID=113540 RepID=A0A8C9V656_SCLFO